MKQILIMRHAKSDWSTGDSDIERPLNDRGKKAAPKMASELARRELVPELILVSPAKRAQQTMKKLCDELNFTNEIQTFDNFYFGDESDILKTLLTLDERYKRILIIGHNPTLEMLIFSLSSDKKDITMPTAAIAFLQCEIKDWTELKRFSCKLEYILKPKDL